MRHKDINQVEDVKISLEVDSSYITIEEDRKADCPHAGHIPPMSESVLHDCKATTFVTEFLDIWRSIGDQ